MVLLLVVGWLGFLSLDVDGCLDGADGFLLSEVEGFLVSVEVDGFLSESVLLDSCFLSSDLFSDLSWVCKIICVNHHRLFDTSIFV